MKPNFSLLARELQADRRTVKKYYNGFTKSATKTKKSKINSLRSITLLNIEKDSLQPLSTKAIRSPYQRYRQLHKVNQSSMITYHSNQYSVPAEYIGKSLLLESDNESLYIYDSIKLVVIHPIHSDKKLNYHPHHYAELLRKQQPFCSNEEVEQ